MQETTWKLYSPLTAEYLSRDDYDKSAYTDEYGIPLTGTDLLDYEGDICDAVERDLRRDDDLAEYIHDDCGAEFGVQLNKKVLSIVPSVAFVDDELKGCTTVKLREPLNEAETAALRDYLTGQFSDGWGEGFEQREIEVNDGVLYVHFWNDEHFYIEIDRQPQTEQQVAPPPKMRIDLTGPGGNIYSVMALVSEALNKDGQREQATEMCGRVFAAGSYEAALAIMGEYMEIEYIRPAQPDRASKPKKKGDGAR